MTMRAFGTLPDQAALPQLACPRCDCTHWYRHSRFRNRLHRFHGVATRYLPSYLAGAASLPPIASTRPRHA